MGILIPDRVRHRASSLLGELKRRDVIKVGVVYIVVGLGAAQAADVFLGNLAPQWALNVALVILLLGFPLAIVLAWVYAITPVGVVRDQQGETSLMGRYATGLPAEAARAEVAPTADKRSIAVLPFISRSDDPQDEYFADGVTDDILTALTMIEGLRVISRTSAMLYKGTTKSTPAIAQELGVEIVLEGSVRRSSDRVRVVTQLIHAERDEHLWAATYDRELQDIFAVQSDIARNVALALRSQLTARGEARLASGAATISFEAYELVARARHAYLQVTRDHVDHGMKLLRQALEIDPDYAEAWAHLALAHFVLPYFSSVAPASIEASARQAIDRALDLDDGLPEAYVARAHWRFQYRYDWAGAERDFAKALELNPSSADAYQWRGLMHLLCERGREAIHEARQSVALDPLSFQTRSQLAQNLIWGGQSEVARPIVEELVEEDRTNFIAHWSLGILARSADPQAALGHFDAALSHRDIPLGHASRSLALRALGRTSEADQVVETLEARAARGAEYVSPFALALGHFGKRDNDRGFHYLQQGIDDHDFLSLYMRIGLPEGVRHDPRFQAAAHRIWPRDFPLRG